MNKERFRLPSPLSILTVLCATFGTLSGLKAEVVYFNGKDFRNGYYIVPDDAPPNAKFWVVVDVHEGSGLKSEGRGRDLVKLLAPVPVIILVPSFKSGYQWGDGKWAEQLLKNFGVVREAHSVHEKMFLHGYLGGAEFVHRFAFNESSSVVGVSAHSAASWACDGGYGSISDSAKGIPFAISCGEEETFRSSAPGTKHTRIEWYHLFAEKLETMGFTLSRQTWPGVSHGVTQALYGDQLKECFFLATQGVVPASEIWTGKIEEIAAAARKECGSPYGQAAAAPAAELSSAERSAIQAASDAIVAGRAPDTSTTLRFLVQYPAAKWAADPSFEALKTHCRESAKAYLEEQAASGKPLAGESLKMFKAATSGLGLDG